MSQQNNHQDPATLLAAPEQTAATLRELARRAEQAGFAQQAKFVAAALEAADEAYHCLFPGALAECGPRALDLARAGAPESAVLALMPPTAAFTADRMHNGAIIARVVLDGTSSEHSRDARWLAMAWLAALLRAIASLIDVRAATPTN